MHYIVGLGNPGEKYAHTRHNAGRIVLARFAEVHGLPSFVDSAKYNALISEGMLEGEEVLVMFPETYMNKSGSAVKKALAHPVDAAQLIVVYDDIDLPLGTVRVSFGRGAGGHRGVASIIDTLGTKDFVRVRIGVAPVGFFGNVKKPKGEQRVLDFLLGDFKRRELDVLEREVAPRVAEILATAISEGHAAAMNAYN